MYDTVVHFRMSGNDSLDVICSMLCAFAAPEAQDHEQGGAQVTYPGFLLTSTCEFLKMVCQTYQPKHADYHQKI